MRLKIDDVPKMHFSRELYRDDDTDTVITLQHREEGGLFCMADIAIKCFAVHGFPKEEVTAVVCEIAMAVLRQSAGGAVEPPVI